MPGRSQRRGPTLEEVPIGSHSRTLQQEAEGIPRMGVKGCVRGCTAPEGIPPILAAQVPPVLAVGTKVHADVHWYIGTYRTWVQSVAEHRQNIGRTLSALLYRCGVRYYSRWYPSTFTAFFFGGGTGRHWLWRPTKLAQGRSWGGRAGLGHEAGLGGRMVKTS